MSASVVRASKPAQPVVGPTIVAFLNFKGGVGKTANVVNIGACLAATHQKRMLLIDLDAQCNTSLWLLGKTAFRQHTDVPARTIGQAFVDKIKGTKLFHFSEALVRGVPISEKGYQLIPNLDLLPATIDLLQVEQELVHSQPASGYQFLFQQTEKHLKHYDYVLIDCAPNFFALTKNAIFLAKHLAVPYVPDFLSLVGFQTLAKLIEGFGAQIGGQKTALGRTRISALIVNRWAKVGNVFQQGLLELEKMTNDLKAQGLIHPGAKVLQPPIRHCVKVAEAPAEHRPILLHAPGSNGDVDYAALTQSFIQHFEELK